MSSLLALDASCLASSRLTGVERSFLLTLEALLRLPGAPRCAIFHPRLDVLPEDYPRGLRPLRFQRSRCGSGARPCYLERSTNWAPTRC
jgi:hypothetical protein